MLLSIGRGSADENVKSFWKKSQVSRQKKHECEILHTLIAGYRLILLAGR
jgi:hypothetical protein